VALNFAALSFMMPLGVAQAACTRVGNLLGAHRFREADRAAWVAIGLGAAVMAVWALVFALGRNVLPRIYTPDATVVALAASVLPIAGAFQIFDGTQVVAAGVMRGMGSTRPAAWLNFVGYWLVALPIAWWLTRRGAGLEAIWWSLCLGLVLVAGGLVLWIRARGPGRLASAGGPVASAPTVDPRAPVG
jgi:MATE family multidrug resistance protein